MSSHRYAPLPDAELEAAFDNDENDEQDSSIHTHREYASLVTARNVPGAYDFEREYDYPPPGSPPAPSQHALPNDYGNSNGLLPTSAPAIPRPSGPSFFRRAFRRAVGGILPSHYVHVPADDEAAHSTVVVGAGTQNDGVFANVVAKPQRAQSAVAPDGSVYLVPEDSTQKDVPPSYADAQADAVPPYWETTVHAPASSDDPNADMIIDDIPTGSPWLFLTNLLVSFFFQFVGFLFTYLLHTSHAAKYGSRAGLGLTLIQFGFYSRAIPVSVPDTAAPAPTPSPTAIPMSISNGTLLSTSASTSTASSITTSTLSISSRDWLAFLFMTLGWFVFLSSLLSYIRIKRWETSIRRARAGPPPPPPTAEAIQRDREIRENLASVFGIVIDEEDEERERGRRERRAAREREAREREEREREARERDRQVQVQQVQQEERLERDLRDAGLL